MAKRSDHLIEYNQDVKEFGAGSGPLVCGSTTFPSVLAKLASAGIKLAAAAAAVAALVYMAAALYVGFAPLSIQSDRAAVNVRLYNLKEEKASYHLVLFNKHDRITRVTTEDGGETFLFSGKFRGKDYNKLLVTEGDMISTRQTLVFEGLEPNTGYEILVIAVKDEGPDIIGRFPFTTDKDGAPQKGSLPEGTEPPAGTEPAQPVKPEPEPAKPEETEPQETEPEETKPTETITPPYIPTPTPPAEDTEPAGVRGEIFFTDKVGPYEVDRGNCYGYTLNLTFSVESEPITPVQIDLEGQHFMFREMPAPEDTSYITIGSGAISGSSTLTARAEIDYTEGLFVNGKDEWTAELTYIDSDGQTKTVTTSGTITPEAYAVLTMKSATVTRTRSYNHGDGDPTDTCTVSFEAEAEIIPGFDGVPELRVNAFNIGLPSGATNTSSNAMTYSTAGGDLTVEKTGGTTYRITGSKANILNRNPIDANPTIYGPYMECYVGERSAWVFGESIPMTIAFGPDYNPDVNQDGMGGYNLPRPTPTPEPDPVPDYSSDAVVLPDMPAGMALTDVVKSGVAVTRLETVSPGELVQLRIRVTVATDAADGETVTLTPPAMTSGKVVVTQPAASAVTADGGKVTDTFWYSFYMPADGQINDLTVTPAA